jgi:hypothetical protein
VVKRVNGGTPGGMIRSKAACISAEKGGSAGAMRAVIRGVSLAMISLAGG